MTSWSCSLMVVSRSNGDSLLLIPPVRIHTFQTNPCLGTEGFEFAKLVVSVDGLSAEFFNLPLNVMLESKEEKLKEAIIHPRDRNRFRDRCIEALQSNQFRIHTFFTNPNVYYEIS